MWNFIPQLFYDFLARVIPGAILIVTSALVVLGPAATADFVLNSAEDSELFSFGALLLWVLGSYLAGLILGQLWEISFGHIARPIQDKIEAKCKQERIAEHNGLQQALGQPALRVAVGMLPPAFVMRDHLRYFEPGEAVRLLKIRAEQRLSQVLILGFILLAVLNAVYLWMQHTTERMVLEIILIVAVVALFRMVFRLHRLLVNGTMVSWLICVSSGRFSLQNTTGKMPDGDGV